MKGARRLGAVLHFSLHVLHFAFPAPRPARPRVRPLPAKPLRTPPLQRIVPAGKVLVGREPRAPAGPVSSMASYASMSKRIRYICLIIMTLVGTLLAIGAWHEAPGHDPDNQGGYVIALFFLLVLLWIYVATAMRAIRARFQRGRATPPSGDA